MKHSGFLGDVIRLVFAFVVAVLVAVLFQAVVPKDFAVALALVIGILTFCAPWLGGDTGTGLRLLFKLTVPLLAWVTVTWLMYFAPLPWSDHYPALAVGSIVAALAGLFAQRHGQGHEHARLAELIVATSIPFVALLECLLAGDRAASVVACGAVAAGFVAAKAALVWPDRLEKLMEVGAGVAAVAGIATAIPIFF